MRTRFVAGPHADEQNASCRVRFRSAAHIEHLQIRADRDHPYPQLEVTASGAIVVGFGIIAVELRNLAGARSPAAGSGKRFTR
jgi:hypothetical protein